ncbi:MULTISPECIES: glycosyltransferase family A protein [Chryseobacterium]|uniref:Glycosyltransferase involved in cell wall biosynthesis n=1 Tax=Chryseobacterium geocarposphaerae TaxID=1416776 RepID=A0ABU1LF68_9FLAO|nr:MULTISPECIES: glycosyltransferase family A protein [Chryseobacterium]MDR6405366.1 glycosyltransferase involved in cell wall biosynthesis [Chryseobacterium geocarposphaerae]MDR6697525.1 glycosyltransferase involved in cell wall biosynthesis [Chryseobacterium ginsenosidimutans]
MKFSVLIANYNNGKFFMDCYESILAQQYTNWEAVIIDDRSTDDSVEVIKKIIGDDDRFKLYENDANYGVGVTKARLIEYSTGDVCGYLDPDDSISPNALKSAVEVLQKKKDVVLTYSRLAKCDQNLNILKEFTAAMQVPNGQKAFFNFPIQIAPFVAFRRDVYLKGPRINPELKIAEDQDLYYKMYEVGKVHFINQTDYMYRAHAGGISQNDNKGKSYQYYARAIWEAMQRRNLKVINGKPVPASYSDPQEIFDLLEYQNRMPFRIKKRITTLLQKLFS